MAARLIVRWHSSWAFLGAVLAAASLARAEDVNPLSVLTPVSKVTLMVDVGSPAVVATLGDNVALPTGVRPIVNGLPKGVVLRPGNLRVEQGSVYAQLSATAQAVPGTYNATLAFSRGKDRIEAPLEIVIEPFELYAAIGKSIRLEIPKGQPPFIQRGSGFAYTADIYNLASRPIPVPPSRSTSTSSKPPPMFPVGTVQRWVERLDSTAPIPNAPPRRGNRYPAGADDYGNVSPLPVGKLGRTSIQSGWLAILPPGQYRLTFEFIPADPAIEFNALMDRGKPAASAHVLFEVR